MEFHCRTIVVETCLSRERQDIQDTVHIKKRTYKMDTVKTHCIDVPFHQFLTHLFFSLLKGMVVGLFFFGLLAGLVEHVRNEEVDVFPMGFVFISIAGLFFVVRGWMHFQIPTDIAIKERCRLDQLKHSQIEAIPERRWNDFIRSIGDRSELIEREVKTDYTRKKKCSYCGKQVHVSSRPGEHCPHCRMKWDKIEDRLF